MIIICSGEKEKWTDNWKKKSKTYIFLLLSMQWWKQSLHCTSLCEDVLPTQNWSDPLEKVWVGKMLNFMGTLVGISRHMWCRRKGYSFSKWCLRVQILLMVCTFGLWRPSDMPVSWAKEFFGKIRWIFFFNRLLACDENYFCHCSFIFTSLCFCDKVQW